MNWIITGGCGFIGTSLIKVLMQQNNHNIRILDNLSTGTREDLANACSFHEINENDIGEFNKIELIVGDILNEELAIKLTKVFSKLISKVNYKKLCISIILLICVLVGVITGWIGLIILAVSTALGIVPAIKGVSRSHMMGCLLIPVMSYFLL